MPRTPPPLRPTSAKRPPPLTPVDRRRWRTTVSAVVLVLLVFAILLWIVSTLFAPYSPFGGGKRGSTASRTGGAKSDSGRSSNDASQTPTANPQPPPEPAAPSSQATNPEQVSPDSHARSQQSIREDEPTERKAETGFEAVFDLGSGASNAALEKALSDAFSVGNEYKSVVYVLDRSGSMSGDPLERVKRHLNRSLDRLNSQQQFSIIFFDDSQDVFQNARRAQSIAAPKLHRASSRAIRNAISWVEGMSSAGGTVPVPAIELAVRMKPDLIIFLSDGGFASTEIDRITALNGGHSVIDCVGIGPNTAVLVEIARRNGGTHYSAR